jgi:hypothetical protein
VCATADAGALVPGSNNNPDAGIPNFTIDAGAPWSIGTAACAASACTINCPPGLTLCSDGICYDTQNFHDHCGSCANACAASAYCAAGQCCPTGQEYCSGACVDVLGNNANCGDCGVVCGTSQTCTGGTCVNGCGPGTNQALSATASLSSGGSLSHPPTFVNDNILETAATCQKNTWIVTGWGSTTEWIELAWTSSLILQSMHLDTTAVTNDACFSNQTATGAQIQWWNGSSWVTDGTVSGQIDDWDYTFTTPVTTTKVRLYSVRSPANYNAYIYEWQVFGCP